MTVNLHTHTTRCHHAVGADEEYVLSAIDRGFSVLGFSDHTPHFHFDGFVSPVRMLPEELDGYCESIRALQKKYAGKIQIHLGVEAEYYPALFPDFVKRLQDAGVEYMLLGQHFLDGEVGEIHCGLPPQDEHSLQRYCDLSIQAMETGLFTYFAHPDFIHYTGDDKAYRQQIKRLCQAAKSCQMPLEINMLGLRQGRHYPSDHFFAIVAEEGCPVVIGSDAHHPEQVLLPENKAQAMDIVERFGLELITAPQIRRI